MPANGEIRPATPADLPGVAAVQAVSPDAAHWDVGDYLDHQFLISTVGNSVAGFLVSRTVAPGERELLNLAVSPDFRRRGIARRLFEASIQGFRGLIYLEVRESNAAAQSFYKSLHFVPVARRQNYYRDPPEAAIVMKFHSC
ncbi:MAG TPA: ribosomal protein S18-alanine N-acetyltransferase [Candidatus Acidoferrales bacterium]|nr:ribosomal protein S18-alanine N-acetyltransferase [Candidatus Acidoferrales bacterium]